MIALAIVYFVLVVFLRKSRNTIIKISAFIPITMLAVRLVLRIFLPSPYLTDDQALAMIFRALPMNMCGIAAMMLPIVVFSKSQFWMSFFYFFSMPGTFITLLVAIFADSATSFGLNDYEMWAFFVPHLMYFIVPASMLIYFKVKPRPRDMKWVWLGVFMIVTVVHQINTLINDLAFAGEPTINHIFTILPGDFSFHTGDYVEYPILGHLYHLMWRLSYWYLFGIIPILIIGNLIMSIPFFKFRKKSRLRGLDNLHRKHDN
jgi:uncharacterized membrane protein YwaF